MSSSHQTGKGSNVSSQADGSGQDRRQRLRQILDELVRERQQVMVDYCRFASLDTIDNGHELTEQLRTFCQDLIDYTAFEHFELFERIIHGTEQRGEMRELAEEYYSPLSKTTDVILAFNDKYDSNGGANLSEFANDIDQLGEILAERIDIEDTLIKKLESGNSAVS